MAKGGISSSNSNGEDGAAGDDGDAHNAHIAKEGFVDEALTTTTDGELARCTQTEYCAFVAGIP